MSRKDVIDGSRGKKLSELSSEAKGLLFHKRMSRGEINAVIAHNKLVDDRTDDGKRKGLLIFPPKPKPVVKKESK